MTQNGLKGRGYYRVYSMSDTVTPQTDIFVSNIELDVEDEEHPINCFICNDKRKSLNETLKLLPENVTQSIVYFTSCNCDKGRKEN